MLQVRQEAKETAAAATSHVETRYKEETASREADMTRLRDRLNETVAELADVRQK